MSFEIYITRAEQFWETLENSIPENEWLKVVDSDSDLLLSKEDSYSRKTEAGEIEKFHPWLITSHPDKTSLWFIDGAIHATSPDESAISKMVELAQKLNARVIDEEGEEYSSTGTRKGL